MYIHLFIQYKNMYLSSVLFFLNPIRIMNNGYMLYLLYFKIRPTKLVYKTETLIKCTIYVDRIYERIY